MPPKIFSSSSVVDPFNVHMFNRPSSMVVLLWSTLDPYGQLTCEQIFTVDRRSPSKTPSTTAIHCKKPYHSTFHRITSGQHLLRRPPFTILLKLQTFRQNTSGQNLLHWKQNQSLKTFSSFLSRVYWKLVFVVFCKIIGTKLQSLPIMTYTCDTHNNTKRFCPSSELEIFKFN